MTFLLHLAGYGAVLIIVVGVVLGLLSIWQERQDEKEVQELRDQIDRYED